MTKRERHYLTTSMAALLLAACTSEFDMQGTDPKAYYAAHPIENRIEAKNRTYTVHFSPHQDKLPADAIENFRGALRAIAPEAAEAIQIQLSTADMHNEARKEYVAKLLRSMGYRQDALFEPSKTLKENDVQVDVSYVAVVLPDCPDWRTSPVTTYSNTMQGNFRCATESNLGLMVADPHDLVRGSDVPLGPDTERASKVIQDYRAGKDFGAAPPAGGTSTTATGQ